MKQLLRKWLYIKELSDRFYEENRKNKADQLNQDKLILGLSERISEVERQNHIAYGIINGLLEHFNLEYYKDLAPDLRFLPPEQKMMEVIKVRKQSFQVSQEDK